jgi:hypothetical protein
MLLHSDITEQLHKRVQATLDDVTNATKLAPLFTALEQACFAPWLDAALVLSSDRAFSYNSRVSHDVVVIDVQQSATLTLSTGEPVLRAIFLLMLAIQSNGAVSAQVDLLAEEYTCAQAGSRIDMQVSRAQSKIDKDGQSCLPELLPALQQNLQTRLQGKGEGGRLFVPLLQHVSATSLDWLTP